MKQLLFITLIALLAGSCAQSLTYSPSLNLPSQPLKKKEVDLQAGAELFPESRPHKVDSKNALGLHAMLSYGFSEKFNLSLKGWFDTEDDVAINRPGFSLTAQFIKQIDPNKRLLIVPRFGVSDAGWGAGLSNSIVYQKTESTKFNWYSGLGVGWGWSELGKIEYNGEQRYPYGYILMAHLGLGYSLSPDFRINCELNPIIQMSTYDSVSHLLFSPSIGIGYTIRSKAIDK